MTCAGHHRLVGLGLDPLGERGLLAGLDVVGDTFDELEPRRLEKARRYLDRISGQWDVAIERLRTLVEDES